MERWGRLLGLEVARDPPAGKDPDDWCRARPATVGFFTVDCALDRFADVSGVTGTSSDIRE